MTALNTQQQDQLMLALKASSRSFYLSMKYLPSTVRYPIGLAYLLARIADTLADNTVWSAENRKRHLIRFEQCIKKDESLFFIPEADFSKLSSPDKFCVEQASYALSMLLKIEPENRSRIIDVVNKLIEGMKFDFEKFSNDENKLTALKKIDDLEQYTYLVAGCVGEFWTQTCATNIPDLAWETEKQIERGTQFGKALQLTNILRDIQTDLKMGRCYLPEESLNKLNIKPGDIAHLEKDQLKQLLDPFYHRTYDYYEDAIQYVVAIPKKHIRLRLTALWPIMIGLKTLATVYEKYTIEGEVTPVKIKRKNVYKILLISLLYILSNRLIATLNDRKQF